MNHEAAVAYVMMHRRGVWSGRNGWYYASRPEAMCAMRSAGALNEYGRGMTEFLYHDFDDLCSKWEEI